MNPKRLTDTSLEKVFQVVQNVQTLSQDSLDYFQPFRQIWRVLRIDKDCDLRLDILDFSSEPALMPLPTHNQAQRQQREFIKWSLTELYDCTHLHLSELFSEHGFNPIFEFMIKTKQTFPYLKTLSLSSSAVEKNTMSFKYETQDEDFKEALESVFKKLPVLETLFIDSFCDDDILSDIIAPLQTLKELRLDHLPLSCPDDQRFTDDGLIDFVKATKSPITTLHLKNSICSQITCKSLLRLKHLKHLKTISVYREHMKYFKHSVEHLDDAVNYQNGTIERIEFNGHLGLFKLLCREDDNVQILEKMCPNATIQASKKRKKNTSPI